MHELVTIQRNKGINKTPISQPAFLGPKYFLAYYIHYYISRHFRCCFCFPKIKTGMLQLPKAGLGCLFSGQHVARARQGFPWSASWKCEEACKASDTPLPRTERFDDICPAVPLYSHRVWILCGFKETKLSSPTSCWGMMSGIWMVDRITNSEVS